MIDFHNLKIPAPTSSGYISLMSQPEGCKLLVAIFLGVRNDDLMHQDALGSMGLVYELLISMVNVGRYIPYMDPKGMKPQLERKRGDLQ